MSTETRPVPLEDELDAFFGQYVASNQARGLVYGLVGPQGLVHSRGFGVANDAGDAPDADTVFPIASMTKSFVACAALMARDRGLVDLEAPITDYVPEFSAHGSLSEPGEVPTVRMLLSMSGGLTEDNAWVDPFINTPVPELLATVAEGLRYSNPPGSVFEYSNLGYALAGLAVGRAVGRRIEDWVHDELLEPLGMHSTCFDNQVDGGSASRAMGYRLNADANADADDEWVAYPPVQSEAFAAAGGIVSSVHDIARWMSWLSSAFRPSAAADDDGSSDAASPVSPSSRRELQRLHQLDVPGLLAQSDGSWRYRVSGYGLGLAVTEDLHYGTLVSHGGGLPGFALNMTWQAASGHGIVVLTNSHRASPGVLAEQAVFRILEHHGAAARTVSLWPETVQMRLSAEQLIREWDDQLAARIFAANIAFDRPLADRRREIEEQVAAVGPLRASRPIGDVVSATSPAHVTWVIDGERGELRCSVHLTPTRSPRIQELSVQAQTFERPRGARGDNLLPGRRRAVTSLANGLLHMPALDPGSEPAGPGRRRPHD